VLERVDLQGRLGQGRSGAVAMDSVRERREEEGDGNRMNRYVCNQWHRG
jgi:hypothetical protein